MDLNSRLYLKINSFLGHNRWLDTFGRAGAEWAIFGSVSWYIVSAFVAFWPERRAVLWCLLFLGALWALGLIMSWGIGLLVKEVRPHLKFPGSKLLFLPLSNWKSFPSDHSMSAWLIFFLAVVFSLPGAWALLPLALWVSWGRVYAGVHYPFDVVGGMSLAGLLAMFGYYLLIMMF